MTFKLACGDVMPGCGARFEDETEEGLLGQVGDHAAADHGIAEVTPEVAAAVRSKIVAA
jgi:predicted small metal-binding protein